MTYDRTLTAALAFAAAGRTEEWVHAYLRSDGRNVPFSDGLKLFPRGWKGPVRVPAGLLTRICGPEDGMPFRVDAAGFEAKVSFLEGEIAAGADLPPLIVHCAADGLELRGREVAALRESASQACALLKALANEDRLLLLCQLVQGERNVGELESLTGIRQPTLSQQLGVLRDEGLVSTRRQGKYVYYQLASFEVNQVMKTLSSLYCGRAMAALAS